MPTRAKETRDASLDEPAGLYLHIPFCSAICPYCDFAVLVAGRDKRKRFVDTLLAEIELHAAVPDTRSNPSPFSSIDTIYFGGGTPSLLEPEDLGRLLDAVRRTFRPRPVTWIYLEANPEDISSERLESWRRLGVNALSLGVQSFDDDELRFLGRRHDAAEARRSVELALGAGFESVSVDLIYGLPDQDASAWRSNLELAAQTLEPQHLSCYELEVHPRTTFGKRRARGELEEIPSDQQAELFLLTHRFLGSAGYEGYEVSNFARDPRYRSRHNSKHWRHVPYLGLGPAAHSFDGRHRWWNQRLLPGWEQAVRAGDRPEAGREEIGRHELALEMVMLAFRTSGGIDLAAFEKRFGFDLAKQNSALVERLTHELLLRHTDGKLAPTLTGMAVADSLAASFEIEM